MPRLYYLPRLSSASLWCAARRKSRPISDGDALRHFHFHFIGRRSAKYFSSPYCFFRIAFADDYTSFQLGSPLPSQRVDISFIFHGVSHCFLFSSRIPWFFARYWRRLFYFSSGYFSHYDRYLLIRATCHRVTSPHRCWYGVMMPPQLYRLLRHARLYLIIILMILFMIFYRLQS